MRNGCAPGIIFEEVNPVSIDQSLCSGCEICVNACPEGVLTMMPERSHLHGQVATVYNPLLCTGCMQCQDHCPDYCITVNITVAI